MTDQTGNVNKNNYSVDVGLVVSDPQPNDHPKQTSNEKTLLGQLIAEISKFGGASKEDASRLAKILLPHIDSYAKRIPQPQPAEVTPSRRERCNEGK